MSEPLTCTSLVMTCSACPSQWNGVLSDGRHLYCRYRWGELTIGVGKTHDDAVGDSLLGNPLFPPLQIVKIGDDFDGTMSTEELQPYLTAFLVRLDAELTLEELT